MKKLALILSVLIGFSAAAQNCAGLYYLQNNKVIEMTITGKKDKPLGKSIYTVTNVQQSGGTLSASLGFESIDSKGKSLAKGTNTVKCTGGIMMMDMKMFIPSAQQEQIGTGSANAEGYLEYPANMKEGDVLKDGQFSMDFKTQSGLGAHINVEITKRKVEGKESVTTPAGTWECFKITSHSKIVIKIGIGIPANTDVTEWYAPNFGIVKTESGSGKTEITSIK